MAIDSISAVKRARCSLSETSSRCVTRSVTATHNFEVTDFSLVEGMGAGKFVSSGTFSVGGCDWRIDVCPDGNDKEDKGYVSVFLCFIRGAPGVRARFSFTLLGIGKDDLVSSEHTNTFESAVFIKKSELQVLLNLTGDCFTIRCALTVKEATHTEEVGAVVVPQPKLHRDLADMLKNGEGADVTFSVGNQLFPAHRCMLAARSMVFKAELFGTMKEKDAQRISIEDMEPATFKTLLHFIYTDSLLLDDCDDNADKNEALQQLLVAADRYGLDRLRLLCEARLCRDIDVRTVATTMVLAEQHSCTQLKDACLGFISSRDVLRVVMRTDGFKHLIRSCGPSVMKEILDKVASVRTE
ncbi:hypothetical protein BS78_06G235500 [Paspalum vaginatum]|nr:hypothetical protein BS78_06G235500 [Paspalum vaginatum]